MNFLYLNLLSKVLISFYVPNLLVMFNNFNASTTIMSNCYFN